MEYMAGVYGGSIWREFLAGVSRPQICHQIIAWENHCEEEDQEGNNSSEIETLPLFPIHSGFQHDFFGAKALDLSSDHSVGENHREEEDQEGNNSSEIKTLPLFPIHGGSQHDFFGVKASDLSSDHSVGENHREEEDQERNNSPEIKTLNYHVLATYG
ncbi:hypothetical protein Tco_0608826 [Tanacetum coccineum]